MIITMCRSVISRSPIGWWRLRWWRFALFRIVITTSCIRGIITWVRSIIVRRDRRTIIIVKCRFWCRWSVGLIIWCRWPRIIINRFTFKLGLTVKIS